MKRTSGILLAIVLLDVLNTEVRSDAANPVSSQADVPGLRKVLLAEANDTSVRVDRRLELSQVMELESGSNESRWQAGYIKMDGNWRPVEKSTSVNGGLLSEYRARRDVMPKTADGHFKMANWCEARKLTDQERAHLIQMLILSDPGVDRTPIYQRMGYRRVQGHWVSHTELQSLSAQNKRNEEQLRKWMPTVDRILRNWNENPKRRKQAQEELNGIDATSAIPALMAATPFDESLAAAICRQLENVTSFESSQALAKIAVQSEWRSVRKGAINSLNGRRVDDFAPALLTAMNSPFSVVKTGNDETAPRLIFREEADRYVAVDFRLVPGATINLAGGQGGLQMILNFAPDSKPTQVGDPVTVISRNRVRLDENRIIDAIDYQVQSKLEEENDRAEEFNGRAAEVLAAVTGQEKSTDPRYWWGWWHVYTGTEPCPKRVEVVVKKVQLPPQITNASRTSHSCLIAGTPVWTETGLAAIDQIQVGDRVLAKDISTGEIGYKPVVHTTVRQPVNVKKFVIEGTAIVGSEGHHFWSSGQGWMKTRELKPGIPIHTVTGMSRIESVESDPQPQPVYNLVVADFHTYFVGPAMVLSHDVTPPPPTNVKVPGLQ